jgi:hypothetical protein
MDVLLIRLESLREASKRGGLRTRVQTTEVSSILANGDSAAAVTQWVKREGETQSAIRIRPSAEVSREVDRLMCEPFLVRHSNLIASIEYGWSSYSAVGVEVSEKTEKIYRQRSSVSWT